MNERAVRHIRSPCFGDIARLTLWLSFFNLAANYRLPESDFCCDSEALQRFLLLCHMQRPRAMSASLIGRLGSSAFRLSITTVSMSLTGSCFSSESAPGPFHHGIRRRGGTIFGAALPLDKRQVQADIRSHLIHRPARDIIPPLGGPQCSPVTVDLARFTPLQRSWSIGTQCRLPRCGA